VWLTSRLVSIERNGDAEHSLPGRDHCRQTFLHTTEYRKAKRPPPCRLEVGTRHGTATRFLRTLRSLAVENAKKTLVPGGDGTSSPCARQRGCRKHRWRLRPRSPRFLDFPESGPDPPGLDPRYRCRRGFTAGTQRRLVERRERWRVLITVQYVRTSPAPACESGKAYAYCDCLRDKRRSRPPARAGSFLDPLQTLNCTVTSGCSDLHLSPPASRYHLSPARPSLQSPPAIPGSSAYAHQRYRRQARRNRSRTNLWIRTLASECVRLHRLRF
jgi:hypothetical protein